MKGRLEGSAGIRAATATVVVAVAGFAAVVSYTHIMRLALEHGQPLLDAELLPLSVDGLVLAASLVLLQEARSNRDAPRLAQAMLVLGVLATIMANVLYGWLHGPVGAAISAWPAVAFIGTVEMLMQQVRSSRNAVRAPQLTPVAADALEAATAAYRASLVAANPLSQRKMMERFGLSRAQATKVCHGVSAESNGRRVPAGAS